MTNFGGIIYLIIFGLTTLFLYIAIRRRWMRMPIVTVLGLIINMVVLLLFSLSQGNGTTHALVVGVVLGGLFTAMTVSTAMFFRNNPPG